MRRSIALLLVAPTLLLVTWGRSPVPSVPGGRDLQLTITPQAVPTQRAREFLGPLRLEGAWQIASPNSRVFGYSALVDSGGGKVRAFNDGGGTLFFTLPGHGPHKGSSKWIAFDKRRAKIGHDVESVAHDPASGKYWLGLEGSNLIVRLSPKLAETGRVAPKAMRHWGRNTGAEAMARLNDGRFIAIREIPLSLSESRLHEGVIFAGDPIDHPDAQAFQFDGPDNFSVVDMAVLPDGRALILMRRLLWPMPLRFVGRIVVADTRLVRRGSIWRSAPVASLASVLPVDNFEAIAAVPQADGRIAVWVMSDDNKMRLLQRTLLWKLTVDPAELPWPRR